MHNGHSSQPRHSDESKPKHRPMHSLQSTAMARSIMAKWTTTVMDIAMMAVALTEAIDGLHVSRPLGEGVVGK